MSASVMEITFTENLSVGAILSFNVINDGGLWGVPTGYTLSFNWVNLRSSNYQVTTGTSTATPGERAAINFETAFNLDSGGMYIVTRPSANVVRIVATNQYSVTEFYETAPGSSHDPSILFNITNGSSAAFAITDKTFSQSASTPCSNIDMNVTTNELATKILSPVVVDPNTNNPFTINVLRGQTLNLKLQNATGDIINESIVTPPLLNASNFTFEINNSPFGASVIVNSTNSDELELEYSLDGTTWQDSNIFPSLAVDNYTLHVRDQYGCTFTKDFEVNEFGIYDSYFYISKSNSFRFANRITWGDSANYKTDENTLSNEVDVKLPTTEIQRFQSADILTNQFKSNYALNTVKIVKCDDTEIDVPVIKKSNNIGLKDKRDARKYDLGGGKTGIYFISGNTYEFVSNTINGNYALNGLTPEWAIIGNYIVISGTWYLIENIIYDEIKNADVIVINNTYTGSEVNIIAGSIYNLFNYEVYEFTIDMNAYIDQKFRVRINSTDPKFVELIHLTEIIWCKVKHEKVLELKYWNTTNTDVFYSTGIQHLIRIPYISRKGKSEGDSEIHKTDTDALLLNADLYEAEEIQFEPVTREIWRKMMEALTHEELYINGVRCIRTGDFNTEGPLGDTDDYVLTVTVLKRGSVYNSQTSGNNDFDSTGVEVPGLIETDSGFVKY